MKRFLAFLFVLIAIGAIAGFAFVSFKDTLSQQQMQVARAQIEQQFLSRLAFSRMLPNDQYRTDAPILYSGYGRDLERMYELPEFVELRDDDSVRKLYAEEHKKGRKDDATLQQVNERIDYTQEAYKELTSGSYRPLVTDEDKGFRMDFYEIAKKPVDGQDRLVVKVLILAGDPDVVSFGQIEMKMKIEDEVEKKVRGKMVMETVSKLAKIEGSGSPNTLVKKPRKWMENFPPGLMVGYYDFPLFPPSAKELKLTMSFGVRTVGGNNLHPQLEFPVIAIDPSWKLPEGASWEAEEIEATPEEAAEFMGTEETK